MKIGIVRASKSDRWTPDVVEKLEQVAEDNKTGSDHLGMVSYHILENAGHWLHSDNPRGLAEIITPSFVELSN